MRSEAASIILPSIAIAPRPSVVARAYSSSTVRAQATRAAGGANAALAVAS